MRNYQDAQDNYSVAGQIALTKKQGVSGPVNHDNWCDDQMTWSYDGMTFDDHVILMVWWILYDDHMFIWHYEIMTTIWYDDMENMVCWSYEWQSYYCRSYDKRYGDKDRDNTMSGLSRPVPIQNDPTNIDQREHPDWINELQPFFAMS